MDREGNAIATAEMPNEAVATSSDRRRRWSQPQMVSGIGASERDGFRPLASLDLFDDVPDADRDVWSHPALIGDRLYVRNLLGVYSFLLRE